MQTNLKKHTLNLRDGDWDYIESIARPNGIATGVIVRTLISNYVDAQRAKESPIGSINLGLEIKKESQ